MNQYYYSDANGQTAGPVTVEALAAMLQSGQISTQAQIVPVGQQDWRPISDLFEIEIVAETPRQVVRAPSQPSQRVTPQFSPHPYGVPPQPHLTNQSMGSRGGPAYPSHGVATDLPNDIRKILVSTAVWAKFCSVFWWIVLGFMALGTLMQILTMLSGAAVLVGTISIILTIIPASASWGFGSVLSGFKRGNSQFLLVSACRCQLSFFRFFGIFILVVTIIFWLTLNSQFFDVNKPRPFRYPPQTEGNINS